MKRLFLFFFIFAFSACSASDSPNYRPVDQGSIERISAPDVYRNLDASIVETIGKSCDPTSTDPLCGRNAICVNLGRGVGVCTIKNCTLDNLETSELEDSCPIGNACTLVHLDSTTHDEGDTICLPRCTPRIDGNPCAELNEEISCAPSTSLQTGNSAVCGVPSCKTNADCNQSILEITATCDVVTGLCFTQNDNDIEISSPCKSSLDCGTNQFCYKKGFVSEVDAEGGYCTKVGCEYGGKWSCPEGSKCFLLGASAAISLCLKVGCDTDSTSDQDGCRDETEDAYRCMTIEDDSVCWLSEL